VRRILGATIARVARSYPGRLLQAFLASGAGNYSGALAYNAFMSMFPLIVGLLAIIGLITHDASTRQEFVHGALTYFPSDSRQSLTNALDGVRSNSGLFGVIGVVGMLWGGSNLFVSMEFTLGKMFGAKQRDFFQQRAMTLVMTVAFAVDVVATIGLNTAASLLPHLPRVEPFIGLVVWMVFMAAVYRIVPNRTYRLRDTWPGVLLASVLMEGLSLLWPLFAGLSHGFSTYGTALALFFLLGTWLGFLGMFILLGAVAIRMRAGEPRARGLFSTATGPPIQTEATQAAEQYGRAA
jgi:membrane protein